MAESRSKGQADVAEAQHSGSVFAVMAILVVLCLPILYVLSLGPAILLMRHGWLDDSSVEIAYLPLTWLHEHTPLRQPLEWYASLWVD